MLIDDWRGPPHWNDELGRCVFLFSEAFGIGMGMDIPRHVQCFWSYACSSFLPVQPARLCQRAFRSESHAKWQMARRLQRTVLPFDISETNIQRGSGAAAAWRDGSADRLVGGASARRLSPVGGRIPQLSATTSTYLVQMRLSGIAPYEWSSSGAGAVFPGDVPAITARLTLRTGWADLS